MTREMMQMVRGMLAVNAEMRSSELRAALAKAGFDVGKSTLREHLHREGLSHSVGRPSRGRGRRTTSLPLAGAELWKAADLELGAVAALTKAIGVHLEQLPAPEGEPVDDRAGRDEQGRFLAAYNVAKARTEPELGGKFDTVERRRSEKALREMRVAKTSSKARGRKDLTLTLLPVVVDAPRWSVLRHWQGEHLGTLVGVPFQPATLDKYARELKLSGAAGAAMEAVTSFWLGRQGQAVDERTGAAVVYCDAATKPVWTHHFTRCAKVSGTGRVMPAISTLFLNGGAGTPLLYRSYSGHVSVPAEVPKLLGQYEQVAGEGTVRRVVVLDRESHAVWLFKELAKNWTFIVPLRKSVVGPNARFEDPGEWEPFGPDGDAVRDGNLWLNDSRKGEPPLRVRAVARRRHRTGKVAWYATNAPPSEFPATDVVRLYFERWPLQEHVFRDGNGRVGLDVMHGYGKKKVTDLAVVDRQEKLAGRILALEAERTAAARTREERARRIETQREAIARVKADVTLQPATLDGAIARGESTTPAFRSRYRVARAFQDWLPRASDELDRLEQADRRDAERVQRADAKISTLTRESEELERRRRIFTVDTELDQILTAYKLTFLNVATWLLRHVLDVDMEMDTLIRSILTLPGERTRTRTTETIRIFRQSRDERAMAAVQTACERLNARRLVRGKRVLRFELADAPG